jgi:predicted Zn-dependent peptidase
MVAILDPLATAPEPGPPITYTPPKIEEARLPNGLRILVVERHELPIVSAMLAIDRGADQAPPGLGGFEGAMLLQGTKSLSALALSDAIELLGGDFRAWADFDSVTIGTQVMTDKLGDALALMADVTEHPAFDAKEIDRERAKRLTAVIQENDSASAILSNAIGKALYPASHPYAWSLLSDEASVKKVDKKALAGFHDAHFRPDHATIAIAGDITKAGAVAAIEKAFGAWSGKAAAASAPGDPPAPDAKAPRIVLIDRPKATQSGVSLALPGVPRSSPDYDAILVMNTILGGQFSSRLNLNLREKHAYTYGASSGIEWHHGPGPYRAGGQIVRESTAPAAREIYAEIERIRTELVSEEELANAKANLIQTLPARFETTWSTANTALGIAIFGLPLDEFTTRPARIARITREDVKRVAEKVLAPERARLVVVGDAAVVRESLAALAAERHAELEVVPSPSSAAKTAKH